MPKTFIKTPFSEYTMGKSWVGLTAVVLLVLLTRLYFAFQTPFYSSDEAYLHLRYTETLLQGDTLWNDPLGYGGRTLITSPLFDAILALFSLFIPMHLALKIVPNIFASLLAIPAFLIAYSLTKHKPISLFISLLASFTPAFFASTFNHISPLTLAIPLFFFQIYAWLKVPKKSWIFTFLLLLLIFVFLNPLSIILVFSIGVYIILIAIEKTKAHMAEYELGLFSIFFTLWAQFLLYKKLILFHGPAVIWKNMPKEMLATFYSGTTVLGAIWQIGIFPLVAGIYTLYKAALTSQQKETQMMLSIVIISAAALWLKLIDLSTGFMLLGIALSILVAKWLTMLIRFIRETKIERHTWMFVTVSIILAAGTIFYPAYAETQSQLKGTITEEEVNALEMLQNSTPETAVIITPPQYGNYVTAIAKRRNVMDDYFFLQHNINERYEDVVRLYKTTFETEAVELFDKYDATHIIVPPGVKDIRYPDRCFKRIQATNIIIYEKDMACEVRVVA